MKLDYLYGSRGEDFRFYQLPALILEAGEYKSLSAQAKILYSVLLSKVSLSRKNGWIEEATDRIYIICHQEEMMKLLGCSRPTAGKALHELEAIGLLEKKRRGLGRPDIIYVKDFSSIIGAEDKKMENGNAPADTGKAGNISFRCKKSLHQEEKESGIQNMDNSVPEGKEPVHQEGQCGSIRNPEEPAPGNKGFSHQEREETDNKKSNPSASTSRSKESLHPDVKDFYIKKSNIFTSRSKDSLHLDVKDFDTRYIDYSYIYKNYIDRNISYPSIYHGIMPGNMPEDIVTAETDTDYGIGELCAVREMVRSRIDYPVLIHDRQMDKALIDSLVELITGVLLSEKGSVRISGEYIPLSRVKERFRKITMSHIQYVLLCMKETSTAIGNIHAYLLTALYQAPETMAFYYQQRINHDLPDTS